MRFSWGKIRFKEFALCKENDISQLCQDVMQRNPIPEKMQQNIFVTIKLKRKEEFTKSQFLFSKAYMAIASTLAL